ncbi:thermonuclease family protein [Leptothoe sp. LEGE 181152]|nr:thermonuclease family protein [Leptothoe sp. LEGE 181152]
MRIWQRRGVMPIVTVLGFCGLSVLAQYLPGVTVKAVNSAVTNVIPGEKHLSQTMWLVPGSIYDGDTLRVTDGTKEIKLRLCGVDAPEKDQPMGVASRDHLRALVDQGEGGQIIVVPIEKDRYGRTVADLFIELGDDEEIHLNSQMVMDGMAYHYERYSSSCPQPQVLVMAEDIAKEQSAGVWANPGAEKPWDYRKRN